MMPDIKDDSNEQNVSYTPPPSTPEITPPPATTQDLGPPPTPFVPDAPPKKSKKKLIIGIFIAVAVALGASGGLVFAHYNSPDRVLLDVFDNSIKSKTAISKGSYYFKDIKDNGTVAVTFTSQNNSPKLTGSLDAKIKITYKDIKVDFQGAGMAAESGDLYFKINNAPQLLEKALETEYGKYYTSDPAVAPLIAKLKIFFKKIDGQWIKIEKKDISQYSPGYDKDQTCAKKVITRFYENSSGQRQVVDIYQKNNFMIAKNTGKSTTINNQDSVAYDIKFNVSKFNAFVKKFRKTDFIKDLNKCMGDDGAVNKITVEEIKESQKEFDKIKTTIWVSRWGHELNQVQVTTNDKDSNLDFKANIDTKTAPNLKDPSKSLDAKDLIAELEAIYMQATGGITTTEL